ncbi:hypothetical protein F511_31802 [Dorcoceras hygrometricum]|uniref:Uncharacterized protein n=1 Tax=Dorcoceras hygrometricum TaxID=472368 RepID=A0A2Z7AFN6_9LAMI|nr:hypothetical protein F511_31802 [Dorcoceras hygrometricum]
MESTSGILFQPRHSGSLVPPEEIIFLSGILVALALLTVRYEEIGGNPIPTIIFDKNPSLFHVFLLALNVGFTAAVMTISLRSKNKSIASVCRKSAVVCCVFAAGVGSCAALSSNIHIDLSSVYSWFTW